MKTHFLSLAGAIVLSLSLSAYPGDAGSEKKYSKGAMVREADKIYHDIMATLPPDIKTKIDSTRSTRNAVKTIPGSSASDSTKQAKELRERAQFKKQHYMQELPEEVRRQVEKAISEMEERQKERALEFKEMKRGY